jgi:hypothetical protein
VEASHFADEATFVTRDLYGTAPCQGGIHH